MSSKQKYTAWCVGHLTDDDVSHIGVYTEERPTSMQAEIQFTITQYSADSVEEALRGAALFGMHRLKTSKMPTLLHKMQASMPALYHTSGIVLGLMAKIGGNPYELAQEYLRTGGWAYLDVPLGSRSKA